MKELIVDLSREIGDPQREIFRDMSPEDEATLVANQAAAATKAAELDAKKASKQAAAGVVKTKASTDPAFAALAALLDIQ